MQTLSGERHPICSPAALQQAEQYLIEEFGYLGLAVSCHSFEALGGTYRNVIASLPDQSSIPTIGKVIVAAHYDTVPDSPGADDNASGLAVMLEVARSLGTVPLNAPVYFIGFCLEEYDLLGSLAYAAELRAMQEAIRGAIVLECVGYARSEEGSQRIPPRVPIAVPSVGNFLAIVGNADSATLVSAIEQSAGRHVPDLKTISLVVPGNGEGLPDSRRSDHAAFWDYGYPAVMLTDTANFRNPHYHQPTDRIDTLDFTFMQKIVVAVTESVRQLGTMS